MQPQCRVQLHTNNKSSNSKLTTQCQCFKSAADCGGAARPNCHESPNILTRNIHTLTDKQYTEQGCRVTAPTQDPQPAPVAGGCRPDRGLRSNVLCQTALLLHCTMSNQAVSPNWTQWYHVLNFGFSLFLAQIEGEPA